MEFLAKRFDTGRPCRVVMDGMRIARVESLDGEAGHDDLPYVAPGLWDIQVNGYGGQEFSSTRLTPEKVCEIVRTHYAFGVTAICPTLTTQSFETLSHGMQAIATAAEIDPAVGRAIVGIHLEGPYISSIDGPRGAHPLQHCRPPCWEEFQRLQQAAQGRIVLHTLSPEYDQAPDFIARSVADGVCISIGHTAATSEQILAAVDAGASLSTHLGNGAHGQIRRHPNYIWDQLAEDRLSASLIVDAHHLPPEVVKTFVRAKTPQRCILVSDESGLAGQPPGYYETSGGGLEILDDGRLVVAGQRQLLAGASREIGIGVANVMRFADVDLSTAIAMATIHPARLLGRSEPKLAPGEEANLVLFREPRTNDPAEGISIVGTMLGGEWVYNG